MENFQQNIKKAFETPVPTWDKDQMWQDIEPLLPPKKRKNRIFFFWLILVVFATGAWMFTDRNNESESPTESPKSNPSTTLQEVVENQPVATSKNPEINQDQNQKNRPAAILSTTKNTKSQSDLKANEYIGGTKIADTNVSKNITQKPEIVSGTDLDKNNITNGQNKSINPEETKSFSNELGSPGETGTLSQKKEAKMPMENQIPLLFSNDKQVVSLMEIKVKTPEYFFGKPSGIQPYVPQKWFVTANFMLAQAAKKSESLHPDGDTWKQNRQNIESVKESITSSLLINRKLNTSFSIGAGLQYQKINEVVTARDVRQTVNDIPSDSAFYYTSLSGTEFFTGNVRQTKTSGYQIYSPNSLTRWSVPVVMRYHLKLGKLRIEPSLGLHLTFLQRYQGIHIGPDGRMIYKDRALFETFMKTSGMLSWSGGIDMTLYAFKDYEIRMGLVYQRDLNQVLRSAYGLSETFSHKGISLEMRKNLSW
jgi:hypothetical protein